MREVRERIGRVGFWGSLRRDLMDALLDRRCPGCGGPPAATSDVCESCDARIDRTGSALCLRCLHGDPAGEPRGAVCGNHGEARILLSGPPYEAPLDAVVRTFKYEGASCLAPWLASLLPEPPQLRGPLGREYLLVPASLHPARRARRGFDQAALLAGEASRRWGVPWAECLERVRDQDPQARRHPDARRAGMAGAFRCHAPRMVEGRPVLLVDDVVTTGSTLLAAAEALESAGAAWVLSLTCTRGGWVSHAEPSVDAGLAPKRTGVVA